MGKIIAYISCVRRRYEWNLPCEKRQEAKLSLG